MSAQCGETSGHVQKMTDMLNAKVSPKPCDLWVFCDEHPDTINDGFFMNRWEEYRWGNLPASYHNGAANLSFADGHAEGHRWVIGDTRRPAEKGGASGTFEASPTTDYDWLKERTSVRKN